MINYLNDCTEFERALKAFMSRSPFVPFCVELVSGHSFTVIHPEAVTIRGETAIFMRPDGKHKLFDGHSVSQIFDREEGES